MAYINPALPTIGQPNSTEDSDIVSAFSTIVSLVNGGLDTANIAPLGVGTSNLAANAVTTLKITDANVTRAKLASDALNSFLKLATAADVKANFGTDTALYSSATTTSLTVNHGLGVTPAFIACTPVNGGTNLFNVVPGVISASSSSQFTVIFGNTGAAYGGGETVRFLWFALG
jgi:hypothetical protein